MTQDKEKDQSKTSNKTQDKEGKEATAKNANAVLLLKANEQTANVKGTHVNFASQDPKEKTQASSDSRTKNTDSDD